MLSVKVAVMVFANLVAFQGRVDIDEFLDVAPKAWDSANDLYLDSQFRVKVQSTRFEDGNLVEIGSVDVQTKRNRSGELRIDGVRKSEDLSQAVGDSVAANSQFVIFQNSRYQAHLDVEQPTPWLGGFYTSNDLAPPLFRSASPGLCFFDNFIPEIFVGLPRFHNDLSGRRKAFFVKSVRWVKEGDRKGQMEVFVREAVPVNGEFNEQAGGLVGSFFFDPARSWVLTHFSGIATWENQTIKLECTNQFLLGAQCHPYQTDEFTEYVSTEPIAKKITETTRREYTELTKLVAANDFEFGLQFFGIPDPEKAETVKVKMVGMSVFLNKLKSWALAATIILFSTLPIRLICFIKK